MAIAARRIALPMRAVEVLADPRPDHPSPPVNPCPLAISRHPPAWR